MNDDLTVGAPGEGGDIVRELPDMGEHQAILSNIVNVGYQKYGNEVSKSPECVFLFEIAQTVKAGKFAGNQMIVGHKMPMYMGAETKMRKFLENWRGKPFTEDEVKAGVQLRKLVGVSATLIIVHNTGKNGKVYANIAGVARAKADRGKVTTQLQEIPKWVSDLQGKQVNPPAKVQPVKTGTPNPPPAPEDDLPF